jgi:hypothetical protein
MRIIKLAFLFFFLFSSFSFSQGFIVRENAVCNYTDANSSFNCTDRLGYCELSASKFRCHVRPHPTADDYFYIYYYSEVCPAGESFDDQGNCFDPDKVCDQILGNSGDCTPSDCNPDTQYFTSGFGFPKMCNSHSDQPDCDYSDGCMNPCPLGSYGAIVDGVQSCFDPLSGDPIPDHSDWIAEGPASPLPDAPAVPQPDIIPVVGEQSSSSSSTDPNGNTTTQSSTTTSTSHTNSSGQTSTSSTTQTTDQGGNTNSTTQSSGFSSSDDLNSDDEGNTAGGGGTCTSKPTCSGDAIQCATLIQQWETRCAIEALGGQGDGNGISSGETCESPPTRGEDLSDFEWQTVFQNYRIRCPVTELLNDQPELDYGSTADDLLSETEQEYLDFRTNIQNEISQILDFSIGSSGGIVSNPVQLLGVQVDFSLSRFSNIIAIIASVLIAFAYLWVFFRIFSSSTK